MWKVAVAIIILWLGLTLVFLRACNQIGAAVDACHPGLVTTEKDGKKSTTFDCTKKEAQ